MLKMHREKETGQMQQAMYNMISGSVKNNGKVDKECLQWEDVK